MKREENEFKNDLPNIKDKPKCKHPEDRRVLLKSGKIDKIWFCSDCQANFIEIQPMVKDAEPEEDVLGV